MGYINEKFEENVDHVGEMETHVKNLLVENTSVREELSKVKNEMESLTRRHIDLQSRSMRDNLIFTGIDEVEEEDTEKQLTDFTVKELKIETDIEFHRVHRIGKIKGTKPRPIVAKFAKYKQRELVRKSAPVILRGNRKYGINKQYPKEINDKRKELYPCYKTAKQNKQKASLIYDKFCIDGKLFIPKVGNRDYLQMPGNSYPIQITRHQHDKRGITRAKTEFL